MSDQLDKAIDLVKQGAYHEASALLDAIDDAAHQREVRYYLGVCAAKQKDGQQAEQYFQSVVAENDSDHLAGKSFINLGAIYKRKPTGADHLKGFRFLESAILISKTAGAREEHKTACQKLAQYLVTLDLFEQVADNRLEIDWAAFRHQLPLDRWPTDPDEQRGIIHLTTAHVFNHYCRDFDQVRQSLNKALAHFRHSPPMLAYVADYQNEVLNQASTYYEKATLLEKVQQDRADLERLFEVGRAMTSVLDLDELLILIVDQVIEVIKAERGFLMLKNDAGQLEFHIARNHRKETLSEDAFTISHSIVDQVVRNEKPLLLTNIDANEQLQTAQSVVDLQLKSVLCVPIIIENALQGVVYIDSSVARTRFGDRELNLITTLINQAKITIENAYLYANLEKKVAERTRELKQANNRLTMLSQAIHQSANTIVITDHNGTIEFVNPAFTRITSYSYEEAIGQNPRLLKSGEHPPEFYEEMWQTLVRGEVWHGEMINKKKNGELYWEEATFSPVRDMNGQITNFVAVKEDITERKRIEDELALREQELRLISDSILDVIFILSRTGKMLYVNSSVERVFGYTPDEMIGKSFSRFIPRDELPRYMEELRYTFRHKAFRVFETWVRTKDGRRIPVEINGQVIEKDGSYVGEGAIRDITERYRATELLKESEEKYRTLVESLDEGIGIVDGDENLTFVNAAAARIFGYDKNELIGKNLLDLTSDKDYQKLLKQTVQRKSGHAGRYELQVFRKDGSVRILKITATPIFTKEGVYEGGMGIFSDITEHKQAEAQIKQQNKFLNSVLDSMSNPFYVINANDYSIAVANSAAKQIFSKPGIDQTKCYGLTHLCKTPCSGDDHPCPLKVIMETKKALTVEHIHYNAQGEARAVEVHAHPIFDADDRVVQMIEYSFDITERKQAEEAIRKANAELLQKNEEIKAEKKKTDILLHNILPAKVAEDLKAFGKTEPQTFKNVTIFFSDFSSFTRMSSVLQPKYLIGELSKIFTRFDEIMEKHGCERIKTIGDAYLAVCGMPVSNPNHARHIIDAAREILDYLRMRNRESDLEWLIRIGIHSGPVVGGIVGIKKYIYDVFGDSINTASRMESHSEPMRINVSGETYRLVKDDFQFVSRTPTLVKGKGEMEMYFVDG